MAKEISQEYIFQIEGKELKPHIVEDSTHPLHTQIQKPFIANGLGSHNQNTYDICLCRGLVKIENNFGNLKNRWIILKNLNVDVKHVGCINIVCCIPYNFCHLNHDVRCPSPTRMQDPYPDFDVKRRVPTIITFERALA